jgi:hypothetical protein
MLKKTRRAALLVFVMLAAWMPAKAQSDETKKGSAIGMEIGEKAPRFDLKDQFGREQSNDTLRGTSGTVLLFFRSADW